MKHAVTLLCALLLIAHTHAGNSQFDPGTLDYEINFNGKRIDWQEFAFFVMPGEAHELKLHLPEAGKADVAAEAGRLESTGTAQWLWHAPDEPGLIRIDIIPEGARPSRLNVIVLVPASQVQNGYLNGYRIGHYPDKPLRANPIYLPPPGFIEVHPALVDLAVSPHFTLGQFLCKQQPDHWPKYLVLREALIAKLEIILAEVNDRGIRTDTFTVMSGYRTPWYNQAIGNGRYSRHVWGGAADIFIDTNGDGRMDDLNGDGRSGLRDARILLSIIDDLYESKRYERLHGGLGLYGPRPHRGPFVHVDARGHEARWSLP